MNKFQEIENVLNKRYIQRERVIRGLVLAVLSSENILIIGPPGTAKSALIEDLAKCLDSKYFSHLLTRFSTPEELFGPISYSKLKQDQYEHVPDGMLQEAHIAFLDEIFKANSSVLNAMLNVMNERVYRDAGKEIRIPLRTMIGASNELMESEALNAMFDRFLLRYHLDYLDPQGKETLIRSRMSPMPDIIPIVNENDIAKAQEEIKNVRVPDDTISKYIEITVHLRVNSNIEISDRRDVKIWNILKAHAWLENEKIVTTDDFDILPDLLWREPEERTEVLRAVIDKAAPVRATVNNMQDCAMDLFRSIDEVNQDGVEEQKKIVHFTGLLKQLRQIRDNITKIEKDNNKQYVIDARIRVDGYIKSVGLILSELMGVSV